MSVLVLEEGRRCCGALVLFLVCGTEYRNTIPLFSAWCVLRDGLFKYDVRPIGSSFVMLKCLPLLNPAVSNVPLEF
jgi:hypothetical protein